MVRRRFEGKAAVAKWADLTQCDGIARVIHTFPIVRRRDERSHGEYRTKRLILEIYDELAEAIATGRPYRTRFDPPLAPPTLPARSK